MPNRYFFSAKGPFTLAELAEIGQCSLVRGDGATKIGDVATLQEASENTITFYVNRNYADALKATQASAVILDKQSWVNAPDGCALLVSEYPYRSYAKIAAHFYPEANQKPIIHPSAAIHQDVQLGKGVYVGENAVIDHGVKIGDHVAIGANSVIDYCVEIGENTKIGSGVYLGYCHIGASCLIHAGVCIGTRGFGFDMDKQGYIDVPQIGGVIIGDNVEVGANSTIDRGAGPNTIIGDGTRIDNLVQIGHNVRIGKGCVIVAQAGIAGSTVLEDYVICAAKSGIAGHLTVSKGAQIGAMAGVMRNVKAGERVGGIPAIPIKEWFRQQVVVKKLMMKREKADNE